MSVSENTMFAGDAISGKMAKCFVTAEGRRLDLMVAITVEATMEKVKVEIPILGQTAKGHKTVGWNGTGSATFHYNTSIFRELMARYAAQGKDFYFDMQIINEDPTSSSGKQVVLLINCNLDKITIAKFDANDEYLDEEMDFTFEDWKLVQSFDKLNGIEQ